MCTIYVSPQWYILESLETDSHLGLENKTDVANQIGGNGRNYLKHESAQIIIHIKKKTRTCTAASHPRQILTVANQVLKCHK